MPRVPSLLPLTTLQDLDSNDLHMLQDCHFPQMETIDRPTFRISPNFDIHSDGPYVSAAAAAQQDGANVLTPYQALRFWGRLVTTYSEEWHHLRRPANSEMAQLMLEVLTLRKYLVHCKKEASDYARQIGRMQQQLQEFGVGIVDADVESVTSSSSEEVAVDDSWEAEEMIPVVHALPEDIIVHGWPLE